MSPAARAEIVVDVAAIRHNVAALRRAVSAERPVQMMTVVKADGYGHGMVESARAARAAGADWLGVATLDEAMVLRAAGDPGRVLCWLTVPGEDYRPAVEADVDLTAYTETGLAEIAAAARAVGRVARVQLKVDTGLSRGGATLEDWPALVAAARRCEQHGDVVVTGLWSHFACSDEPGHRANEAQERAFRDALQVAEAAGLRPEVRHLANSAGALLRPSARFDLVRCGLASYGLDPAPGHTAHLWPDLGLVPAMTVRARLALVKPVAAGAGVSYGHTWTAPTATTLGLVPVGYGDGVPRHASNAAEAWVDGKRRPVRGRICMDQFVVDLGGDDARAGDEVLLFGPGTGGEPTAQDWAAACGTISYEIVTRIGGRMARRHVDRDQRIEA
ncbi:alanine racemase [Nocardioides panaciterrulae]|uniref:Alanine racemase n=1 Tax=Nocardioides panaciterrulae TaxID=661492 RepID=A0A7Y9E480_9ACTN|nr:alanine racemase [Nocardioides panaciterrulae]NYD40754.1 alanine racemase [Nocardioides panaciterrulae]